MLDVQAGEFRSRMERIRNGRREPKRVLQRDIYGIIVTPQKSHKGPVMLSVLRSLALLFVAFTIFKAVLIHNADQNNYDQMIVNLMAGDSKSQIIARAMGPDYFTKPIGVFITDVTGRIEGIGKK